MNEIKEKINDLCDIFERIKGVDRRIAAYEIVDGAVFAGDTAFHIIEKLGRENHPAIAGMPDQYVEDLYECWENVEITENAIPLEIFEHPKQALYIVGPEDGSLIVPKGKTAVYVPTIGSMNQAMSVCTVLWDRYLKLKKGGKS